MADQAREQLRDAEIAVIGSMLIDAGCIGTVLSTVAAEDFLSPACRTVFGAIRALFLDGKPVDPVIVNGKLEGAYGDFLEQCIEVTPTAAHAAHYCEILKQTSRLLRLRDLGMQLASAADMDDGAAIVQQISSVLVAQSGIRHIGADEMVQEFYARVSSKETPTYIPIGFPPLDEKLYIENGDVVGIGAAPSTGKTAFALQWAIAQAAQRRVGFYSLETNARKATDRIMAREAEVSLSTIKRRSLSDDAWKQFGEAATRISGLRLEFIPAQGMTAADIMADAAGRRYEMIFVDYLQLVAGGRKQSDRYEIVTESSMTFHLAAQRLGITVVLLSQLSRPEKSKSGKFVPPDMHSFRESGQIEQDLDVALLMWLTDPNNYRSDRHIKIGKNKEGEKGDVDLTFDGRTQTFRLSVAGSYREINKMGVAARRELAAQRKESDYADAERAGKDAEQQAFEEMIANDRQ